MRARTGLTDGALNAPVVLKEGKDAVPVVLSTAIFLRFDRFLLPDSISRQAFCLRPNLGDVKNYTECSGNIMLSPSYDPVKREVVLRLDAGKHLATSTTYKLTLFVPLTDGDCDKEVNACGLRAFDQASLAEPYTFMITTIEEDPGMLPDDEPPPPDWCGDKGAALALSGCAYSPCHAPRLDPNSPLGAAMGLNFFDVAGVRGTAIDHVAHHAQVGEHADDLEESSSRFGRAMAIIDAKSPGDSYLMYKVLTGASVDKLSKGIRPSDEEVERLRASIVVGMPMPPSDGAGAVLSEELMINLSDWIAGGAPTPDCP